MKKNYLKELTTLCITILLIAGCKKEATEINYEGREDHKNDCRLVFATNTDVTGIFDFKFHYNNKGLADKWDIANFGLFEQEYDADGKLKKSIHTENDEVIFTVSFFYKKDKVVKEILYVGGSTEIGDEEFFYYDTQGRISKVQSFMNDWVAIAKYTPEGNLSSSELFFSGSPVYSAFWTYKKHYKNPYLAVPGIDHAFPFYTPAELFSSKWLYASLKQVAYDENANPIVLFEYDPSKTVWQAGPHNYPGAATYFDLLGAGWFTYKYEFENCGGDGGNDHSKSQIAARPAAPGAGRINPMMLLIRNPSKSMKEQVKEWRQQLKNINN